MSSKSFTVTIDKIVEETPRVRSFYFKYSLKAGPGQYLKVDIPGVGIRPFGAVVVDNETFFISVGKVGAGTTKLHKMRKGEPLTMEGPFGTSFTLPEKKGTLALIAGGYGLAPLSFLARVAAEIGHSVSVFAGARSANEFLNYPFLNNPNITIIKSTDDGTAGKKGFVSDAFREECENTIFLKAYIVGPPSMAALIFDICEVYSIPYEVSLEKYAYEPFGPVVSDKKRKELETL